jgi:MinD superfamily P-loop ATPase
MPKNTGISIPYNCEGCGACPAELNVRRMEEAARPKQTGMKANQDGDEWSNCTSREKSKKTGIKV